MKYIVWGCGVRGIWLKKQLENAGMEVAAFADNDLGKIGKKIENIPVISIWRLKKEFASGQIVIPGTFGEAIVKRIVEQVSDVVGGGYIYSSM